ncbi:hypothetical protein WM008_20565 [Vibrio vulnificus]|uniref:hypothetical protein n=1 Tax=Vibrio vulnificus TaxID=672 RepID=UPI0010288B1E|nr:hypothetical protein [Vibrio vulnificus]RZP95318.1 hypothetical protein D8T54_14195 [Vibrio vulnificus]WNJ73432.1 hypothetical protein RI132_23595 [Vibrio vulnificus]HDY7474824.1 hypothetical protein [Vibrio vulnificus]HDY7818469.1 hypothetical protein [Vibrio vulnificus]HDY8011514.1 hypothetical protein [Vibrio vulnificus]
MSQNSDTVQIPTDKLLEAFLHSKQFEQHYATQESVDNLKERMNEKFADVDKRFEQVDKRFEQVDRRFDKLEKKFDRMQWLIVASALTIIFKDHLFKLFVG